MHHLRKPRASKVLSTLAIGVAFSVSSIALPIEPTYFGAHVHRSVQNVLWKTVGFGSIRLHDANVTWAELQPNKERWNWEKLDKIVEAGAQAKVDILLPLNASPQWASSTPLTSDPYGPGSSAPPKNLADWDAYVETVVRRYKGRIHAYEIWNEPNLKKFFSGSPKELAELTRRASNIIRTVDKDAKVVCSGITGSYGIGWLKQYLQTGAGNYCDVIGYHFYTSHQAPEKMVPTIIAVESLLREFKLADRPLWNTETGWLIALNGPVDIQAAGFGPDSKVLSAIEAANYIPRALILGRYFGLDRFYWYSWDHPSMGMSAGRGIGWTKPARVFSETAKFLRGADIKDCKNTGPLWQCKITLENTQFATAIWSDESTIQYTTTQAGQVLKFANFGELEVAGNVSPGDRLLATQDIQFIKSTAP